MCVINKDTSTIKLVIKSKEGYRTNSNGKVDVPKSCKNALLSWLKRTSNEGRLYSVMKVNGNEAAAEVGGGVVLDMDSHSSLRRDVCILDSFCLIDGHGDFVEVAVLVDSQLMDKTSLPLPPYQLLLKSLSSIRIYICAENSFHPFCLSNLI